jgi:hypothetical protein
MNHVQRDMKRVRRARKRSIWNEYIRGNFKGRLHEEW